MPRVLIATLLILMGTVSLCGAEPLLTNGGFESGFNQWASFWSRDGKGNAVITSDTTHAGSKAAQVRYDGNQDWSLGYGRSFPVTPGQIYELTGWLRVPAPGSATLGVILYDANNKAISWTFGGKTVRDLDDWQQVRCRFIIPQNGKTITPRLIGSAACQVWLDDVSLVLTSSLDQLRSSDLPKQLTLQTDQLVLTFHPTTGAFELQDRSTGKIHRQHRTSNPIILSARKEAQSILFDMLKPDDMLTVHASLQLEPNAPECLLTLRADGPMDTSLQYPEPFTTAPGDFLIMPVNEGISYPVDDKSLRPMHYHMFGGHGLCMGFWGVTDLDGGLMAVVETPDDAVADVPRVEGRLCIAPQWLPQKTDFGAPRRIRYIILRDGGYVAMCKRYRQYAKQIGRFKTLAEKRKENPYVDRLIGAVNVWNWDPSPVAVCREMQAAGIGRILWSHRAEPDDIRTLNEMGILTSRYDIYQDVMNPANFPKLHGKHLDWTTAAWPNDIIIGRGGDWTPGWRVKGKDGEWYPCGVLCDRRALKYAQERIPPELKTHAYHCRFIDTATAAAWRECYSPAHPMTRTESRKYRMELLNYISDTCNLVTGSETGHDAAVPFVHYFEGMLSLGPYRVPDAGRAMQQTVTEVPERVAKFQTGHYYRIPLWELVYHDCVVAQWYWGDYNNKLPALWDRRDLFNALYGTAPMFMFNRKIWNANRDRFIQSYNTATPVARATGYVEMLSHKWLTPDHAVQQTQFANGVVVTVNFGSSPFTMPDRFALKPMSRRVQDPGSQPNGRILDLNMP